MIRYVPERSFPTYSFVGGHQPRHEAWPGNESDEVAPLSEENWSVHPVYLFAIDLFNHGYYWESHEQWESLWWAAGRTGDDASMLKGLIKLAAASIKLRVGHARGVTTHCNHAASIFTDLSSRRQTTSWRGLSVPSLVAGTQAIKANFGKQVYDLTLPLEQVHSFCLVLDGVALVE